MLEEMRNGKYQEPQAGQIRRGLSDELCGAISGRQLPNHEASESDEAIRV